MTAPTHQPTLHVEQQPATTTDRDEPYAVADGPYDLMAR